MRALVAGRPNPAAFCRWLRCAGSPGDGCRRGSRGSGRSFPRRQPSSAAGVLAVGAGDPEFTIHVAQERRLPAVWRDGGAVRVVCDQAEMGALQRHLPDLLPMQNLIGSAHEDAAFVGKPCKARHGEGWPHSQQPLRAGRKPVHRDAEAACIRDAAAAWCNCSRAQSGRPLSLKGASSVRSSIFLSDISPSPSSVSGWRWAFSGSATAVCLVAAKSAERMRDAGPGRRGYRWRLWPGWWDRW